MSVKNLIITVTASTIISSIGVFVAADKGVCGIVRNDGSICQKLAGGKKDCKEFGGTWDKKKNCCIIPMN